jgi:hypothetical protein
MCGQFRLVAERCCTPPTHPRPTAHPVARTMSSGMKVMTDHELYVAPAVGGGYLNVDPDDDTQ